MIVVVFDRDDAVTFGGGSRHRADGYHLGEIVMETCNQRGESSYCRITPQAFRAPVHEIAFQLEFLIGLFGVVALLAQLARMVGVPYPIFLVLGGIGVGLVPGLPEIDLPPEIIFLAFIPPLLLSAALSSSPRDLRANARPTGLLAVGLVLLTMTAVAAFVLGDVVAPTDPVAAEATFRRLGVPDRVQTIAGGESIINDGTALVAYNIAAAVVTGTFSVAGPGLEFPCGVHPDTGLLLIHRRRETGRLGHPGRCHPSGRASPSLWTLCSSYSSGYSSP